jgi:hypothetical protein
MANILTALRTCIYNRLTTSSTFRTAITQSTSYYKAYFHIAPQMLPGTTTILTYPYCVFDFLPMDYTRDSVNKFYDIQIQFRISSLNPGDCETTMGYLTDLIEDSEHSLTMTGYNILRIERQPMTAPFLVDIVWNGIVQYKLEIQKQ